MAGRGGLQRPANPAPVSGPGRLSQRTDGGPGAMQGAKYVAGLPYGEGQEFQEVQSMAPMSAAPKVSSASARQQVVQGAAKAAPLTALNADTTRPAEPVTAGIGMGPGAGPEAIALSQQHENPYSLASSLLPLLQHDTTGDVRALYDFAVNRGW